MTGHIRNASVVPCKVVLDLVDGLVLTVDGTDQHVVGDVIEVTTELQPGSGSTDVVGGAFPLHLYRKKEGPILTPSAGNASGELTSFQRGSP